MQDADYYISDLHLAPDTPGVNSLFFTFLETEARGARSLTIIGDFLEAYSGYKQLRIPFTAALMMSLQELAMAGTVVRFVAGNRDFELARDCHRFGVEGYREDVMIEGHGELVAAIHGDSFCLDDKAYLRFRRLIRAMPTRWLNHVTTPGMGQFVTRQMRKRSKARHVKRVAAGVPRTYYDIKDEAVRGYLAGNGADTVICGHIHQPQERRYADLRDGGSAGAKAGPRMLILGDWSSESAVIGMARPRERIELVEFVADGVREWPHEVYER